MNSRYEGILKLILNKQGINLKEITEFNVLNEFMRIKDKESMIRESLRNNKSTSLKRKPIDAKYVTNLKLNAVNRKVSLLIPGVPKHAKTYNKSWDMNGFQS